MLGLPNGTESTQMDQGFTKFKPALDKSTVQVAAIKVAKVEQGSSWKRQKEIEAAASAGANSNNVDQGIAVAVLENGAKRNEVHVVALGAYLEKEGDPVTVDDDGNKDNLTFQVKDSMCNVEVDNCDLSGIVNRFWGDPIKLCPLTRFLHIQKPGLGGVQLVFFQWTAMYWMKRRCISNGGSNFSCKQGEQLRILVEKYKKQAEEVTWLGLKENFGFGGGSYSTMCINQWQNKAHQKLLMRKQQIKLASYSSLVAKLQMRGLQPNHANKLLQLKSKTGRMNQGKIEEQRCNLI